MSNVDQRGFDNQSSGYVSAREAARALGVKLQTLYAYASRGMVRSVPGPRGRGRLYAREDLETLRARHDARAGHGAVAAGALRWGEPVLESALTAITASGPAYRGHEAVALAARGSAFESVAELLWRGGELRDTARFAAGSLGVDPRRLRALLPADAPRLAVLSLLLPALGARDPGRIPDAPDALAPAAGALLLRMAASLALPDAPERVAPALGAGSVAGALAHALSARGGRAGVAALNAALVLCADHELNASAFAARVAASAGADLYHCVSAAAATLSGAQHGGMCDRVEALLDEAGRAERARAVVKERAQRGDAIPGFGHRLYPQGDPRARPLLALAEQLAPRDARVKTLLALVRAMRESGRGEPTVDAGLVALAAALGLPRGAAVAVFAVGRTAGWVAHALEQHRAGFLLRPRARYVGA